MPLGFHYPKVINLPNGLGTEELFPEFHLHQIHSRFPPALIILPGVTFYANMASYFYSLYSKIVRMVMSLSVKNLYLSALKKGP